MTDVSSVNCGEGHGIEGEKMENVIFFSLTASVFFILKMNSMVIHSIKK